MLKLSFENFNGVPSFSGEIDNKLLTGKNATGKTSALSAIIWVLSGYDIEEKDNPKKQKDGKHLDLVVKADLEFNGLRLGRTFQEKWVKNRQTLEKQFKGNEYGYSIDGKTVDASEFNDFLKQYKIEGLTLKESIFSFMLPNYFSKTLDEKKREKVVYDNISPVSVEDVAKMIGMPELADWYKSLDDPEKERSELVTLCNKIKKEVESLESAQKEKVKDAGIVLAEVDEVEKMSLKNEIKQLDIKINNDTSKAVKMEIEAEKSKFIADYMTEKASFESSARKKAQEQEDTLNAKRTEIIKDNELIRKENAQKKDKYESDLRKQRNTREDILRKEKDIENLRAEFVSEREKVFSGGMCPVLKSECEQLKNSPEIVELESKFNLEKSEKLAKINERGVKLKEELETLKTGMIFIPEPNYTKEIEVPERSTVQPKPFEKKLDTSDLDRRILEIKPEDKSEYISRKTDIEARLKEISKLEYDHEQKRKDLDRVDELGKEIDEKAKDYTEKQKKASFINQFNVKKAELLEGDAKEKFGFAIKLFEFQINGTPKTICRFMDNDGVEFQSINNASRMNNGIILCDNLQTIYGVDLPVLADNTESVNYLAKTKRTIVATRVTYDPFKIENM